MTKSACKIYYLPIEGGKFEEVPTVEYSLPEPKRYSIMDEDPITKVLLAGSAILILVNIFAQAGIWLGWW